LKQENRFSRKAMAAELVLLRERSARKYALWRPEAGCHAEQGACAAGVGELGTPPLRWQVGQVGTTVTVPAYARRHLAEAYQHAA
jgi:hypothetical protein